MVRIETERKVQSRARFAMAAWNTERLSIFITGQTIIRVARRLH